MLKQGFLLPFSSSLWENCPVEKIVEIIVILEKRYGIPENNHPRDPLTELVFTILSQNTTDINRDRAFKRLTSQFPSWGAALDAPLPGIEDAIRVGGLGAQKSRRIKEILFDIKREHGSLSLEFLRELNPVEAKERLLSFKGVGHKTASIVLLFSLGMPAFPVDTHIYRVSRRLGLVPERLSEKRSHELLEKIVPAEKYYSFHRNLISLGKELCKPKKPKCHLCPLEGICAFAMKP